MPVYSGQAVLVLHTGLEHDVDVHVQISRGPIGEWSGQVEADEAVLWDALNAPQSLTLRAADGSEGQVLVVGVTGGSGQIAGVGAPPAGWL